MKPKGEYFMKKTLGCFALMLMLATGCKQQRHMIWKILFLTKQE